MEGAKPINATHKWYYPDGSFRAWLKVTEWVYSYDAVYGWLCVAKSIESLSGSVKPC